MIDTTANSSSSAPEPIFTPPSLPKGGGTVSAGGGMLSFGGSDGGASWSLPLPLPGGRTLAPQMALRYASGGGNSPFGAGWELGAPAVFRMNRFGVPRYNADDRLVGPDGEEILRDKVASRTAECLPFSTAELGTFTVSSWVPRSGNRAGALEHWVADTAQAGSAESAGFWLQWSADGSITLYGWSDSARLRDPQDPTRVAGWYIEETVDAVGEHVVYTWRGEDDWHCCDKEKQQHAHVTHVYLDTIYARNIAPAAALLVPDSAFAADDFLSFMCADYGERGADPSVVPLAPGRLPTDAHWPLRTDTFSFWRYGFEVRTRRLCRDVLLWQRTARMAGGEDSTAQLISRLHLTYDATRIASTLLAAQVFAYEADGTLAMLPPTEFALSQPGGVPTDEAWAAVPALAGFYPQRWQFADLYGEGLPGLLYLDDGAWWYRAPGRDPSGGPDAVTWETALALPLAPDASSGQLVDLDGDGRPQWLVSVPGLNGSFTLSADGKWDGFMPLDAMPSELLHPSVQMADLTGGGLQDVVMIGPRSVRLWASAGARGWLPAQSAEHPGPRPLPTRGDETRLVAFADPAGSGQQHLVEISGDGVTYWPSLGHGHFAQPISMEGFAVEHFAASRVFLGDTDGSGTTDILYVEADRIRVFISEAGNAFHEAPPIATPEGLHPDDTWSLQVADVRGQGTAELLLTVSHPRPRSWLYRFNATRPWLLSETCDNMGGRSLLTYRSSAQGWLDEKAALKAAGKPAVSSLPFPVHMLSRVTKVDDISGLVTDTEMHYRRGVWDGREREFRGFTRLVQRDTSLGARGTAGETSPPVEVRTWFLSGVEAYDGLPDDTYLPPASHEHAFTARPTRLTQLTSAQLDEPCTPTAAARQWLLRALKGMPVRTEVYGLDASAKADVPYSISRQRWQVRACATDNPERPAALVIPVETLSFAVERIIEDPVVTQSVVLGMDAFGTPLRTVQVHYPRRQGDPSAYYPDTLPEGLVAAAQDDQQYQQWLTLERTVVVNRHDRAQGIHLTGLALSARSDILWRAGEAVEPDLCVERLTASDGPLSDLSAATLGSYTQTRWFDQDGRPGVLPGRPALAAYTETALLEEASLGVFRELLSEEELQALLATGGYHDLPLPAEDGSPAQVVKTGRYNLPEYLGADAFYRLRAVRPNELTGATSLEWDPACNVVMRTTDAAGLTTSFEYDWRFMTPVKLVDPNDNVHESQSDVLGRAAQTRFHGTENGVMSGYTPSEELAFNVPLTVDAALGLGCIAVHTAHRTVADSWMPVKPLEMPGAVPRIGELALRRWRDELGMPAPEDPREGREPPHVISLLSDRYDTDPQQQVRISVTYSDGTGRVLQTAVLSPRGEAFELLTNGALATDASGRARSSVADPRWAVSGKTEYDQKGQVVRTWLPFYLDTWKPVYDASARDSVYADTHRYDALGREYRVLTAAGWERGTQFYPWFTVAEDENDTAEEVLARREAT